MAAPWEKYKQQSAPSAMPIGAQDPTMGLRVPQAEADLAGRQVQTASAAQDMGIDRRRLDMDEAKARIEMEAARRAAAEKDRERRLAFAPMEALNDQMRRAWDTYAEGPGSTPPNTISALADFNPYSKANSEFNTVAAGIGQQGLSAFRVPGAGSQSDVELQAFMDANQPAASDTDAMIQEKLANIERRMGPIYAANGRKFEKYRPKGMIGGGGSRRGNSGPVRISGDAGYNALPKGARYIGPDNVERIK